MKKFNKIFFTLAMGAALMAGTTSCDDFEEININPGVAGAEVVKPYYALNNSIIGAQQDPHIAERIAVYNWASAARISGSNSTYLSAGRYDDGYNNDYHGNSFLSGWIKNATMAITLADEVAEQMTTTHDQNFNKNTKSFARIWRAVLISEYADNFGPYPIEAFQGTNPEFNSVKDVYYFLLDELKAAVADIVLTEEATSEEAKSDPLFGFNAQKWAKYGNSLRLRLAMRLSRVDNAKAKSEFEAVDKSMLITTMADIAKVKEYDQWNAWAGIYSRSWNYIDITSTMSNILTGLGGVSVAEQRPDLVGVANFKPMNYLGLQFADHYADKTDNPTKGYWMDGIPENLDPRALRLYCLPNDEAADNFMDYGSTTNHDKYYMKDEAGEPLKINGDTIKILASHTWNYYPAASRTAWSPKFAKNGVSGSYPYTLPVLCKTYGGNSQSSRVWFGPWETHFLLAEAALYGWNAGTTAEAAYEQGIRTSFENFGVSQFVDAYLQSEDYNRIGVSVKFSHTAEPTDFTANYVNGYDNQPGTTTYEYPDASKSLYKDGLNTQLAKIITQKYIAQTPYGSLEIWNDRRRLGLPWFDIPNNETVMVGYDMANTWTPTTYETGQTIGVFPQRLRYPTSLRNADEAGYNKALELLGGENTTITPLWWAIH
ncbi:MAG: SusD/RagB family nutrient-binding outer membrane lipoprotein [Bacteroides sp.]|nr:SusD/RagB family nutrient-binding outer membrane lipoprotein [Bacteroides sp.]